MTETKDKLKELRAELMRQHVDGFLVPRGDEYLGEYVPACAERLAWLTGFTGSAGVCVVLQNKAVVLTDGRYSIQVKDQVDETQFETADSTDIPTSDWIVRNAGSGTKVGYDPKLHTSAEIAKLEKKLGGRNIALIAMSENPLDAVWYDRPVPPASPISIFPETVAGMSNLEKRQLIADAVRDAGGKAVVIAQPDSIAWLLNIRGADVPHTPLVLSYAILHESGDVDWFVAEDRISQELQDHLDGDVSICDPKTLGDALTALADESCKTGKPILLDTSRSSYWFQKTLEDAGADIDDFEDPCLLPRACKTPAEQQAIIDAHVRDGVAMARFLKWLDDEAPGGNVTELDVDEKLLEFRSLDKSFHETSFDTIAGWAGNGAIVHYRATPEKHKTITPPGILLVDSGAQYSDGGTTDITRTIAVGQPTDEMRDSFTRVLKGHIDVAMARFPEGTVGAQIDDRARKALWDADMDYDHGTGHGVGCFLSVHEEAAGISKRGVTPFKPGMLISNEPGYYKEGEYGIRIESLVLVREDGKREGTDISMLCFETVTLAPIDKRLIVTALLTPDEKDWINAYHKRVYEALSPHLDDDVKSWLKQATAPLRPDGGAVSQSRNDHGLS